MKRNLIIGISIGIFVIMSITLIIISSLHTHEFGEWQKYRDSSCSSYGIERRFCSCGEIQEQKIDKLPHIEGDWIFDDSDNTKKLLCINCEKVLDKQTLENHTHNWSEWTTEKEATCTEKGLNIRNCECGAKENMVVASLGHSFDEWIIVNEAKCEISGLKEHTCRICDYKETKIIEALTHTEGNWIIIENEKHFLCTYCEKTLRVEEIYISAGLNIVNDTILGIGNCSDMELVITSSHNNQDILIIGKNAFEYQNITGIVMPDSITTIKENAFFRCANLETIIFASNLTIIEKKAFYNCTSLKSISLPDSLTVIGESAFAFCDSLETIYISNSITKLEMRAFQYCESLTAIYFDGTIEEWNAIVKDEEWDLGIPSYTIYCNDGTINK